GLAHGVHVHLHGLDLRADSGRRRRRLRLAAAPTGHGRSDDEDGAGQARPHLMGSPASIRVRYPSSLASFWPRPLAFRPCPTKFLESFRPKYAQARNGSTMTLLGATAAAFSRAPIASL